MKEEEREVLVVNSGPSPFYPTVFIQMWYQLNNQINAKITNKRRNNHFCFQISKKVTFIVVYTIYSYLWNLFLQIQLFY